MLNRPTAAIPCALAALLFAAATSPANGGVTVDGNLSEWGVTNASASSWSIAGSNSGLPVFGTAVGSGFSFSYMREDITDIVSDSEPLGPNSGGQRYDAEFMGVGNDGANLVIAIVTGQRRDNGFTRFSPGDIRIATNQGVFGIEVGGGAGTSTANGASVVEGVAGSGSTYALNSSGFTTGHTASSGPASTEHRAGTMWKTTSSDWILDPINGGTPPRNGLEPVQMQFTGGTYAGTADYIYRFDSVLGAHAVIELSIALSSFNNAIINSIQWAPSCGNDFVYLDNQAIQTPEPATLAMGLLGVAGIGALRRFRRTAA